MIHAYDEQYLYDAMRNLEEAFDFAWTVCCIELDTFLSMMDTEIRIRYGS